LKKIDIKCPICDSENVKYVLFGYPSEGMIEAEAKGRFMLGGCVLGEANWFCIECQKYFKAKTKMPSGYCFNCQAFLGPDHTRIEENDQGKTVKICVNCNGEVSP